MHVHTQSYNHADTHLRIPSHTRTLILTYTCRQTDRQNTVQLDKSLQKPTRCCVCRPTPIGDKSTETQATMKRTLHRSPTSTTILIHLSVPNSASGIEKKRGSARVITPSSLSLPIKISSKELCRILRFKSINPSASLYNDDKYKNKKVRGLCLPTWHSYQHEFDEDKLATHLLNVTCFIKRQRLTSFARIVG